MCDHENKPCPGRPCQCPCMNCLFGEAGYEEDDNDLDHDCPYQVFLDDPITRAYGVGSEMIGLISCPVCDTRE